MPARLTVHFPSGPARVVPLPDDRQTVVGRDPDCDVVLDDDRVSRRHARLVPAEDGWTVADLGSKNGTLVDGGPAAGGSLSEKSWISFGGLVARFESLTGPDRADAERWQRFSTTLDLRRRLTPGMGLSQLLPRVVESMLELSNAERGFLLLAGPDGDLEVAARSGLSWEDFDAGDFSGSLGAVQRVLATEEPVVSADALSDVALAARASIVSSGIRALLCVPVHALDRLIGVMYADSRKPGAVFTELDLEILQALASQAGLAIAVARLDTELKGLALRITEAPEGDPDLRMRLAGEVSAVLERSLQVARPDTDPSARWAAALAAPPEARARNMRPLSADDATRTVDDSAGRLAPGARLAGRYRIVELVGIGGMGMVYKAEDEQLGLPVAVKVLRPELAQDGRRIERFKQELVLARQVSHPNVVRIHDLGSDGDLVFLTMDFVAGRSLGELLAADGRLPPGTAAGIARQIAAGLAVAHEAGVVHRDLKPGNVLIDDSGRAAISDFGVARSLAGPGQTVPGAVVGTLDYLSPEQARGGQVDGRTDLYALGILLHEMLTGELPFAGGSAAEVLAQRLTGATRDLRSTGVSVPPKLAAIVRRLLQREPDRRYVSAQELIADLDGLEVAPRAWRRTPRAALAATAVLGLLAAGWTVRQRVQVRQDSARRPAARQATVAGHAVALLPLADETGRGDLAWVASGLPEMLAQSLAEGPGLRVLDSERVFQTLTALKLAAGPLPDSDARRLAELLDADRLVSGRVRAAGDRLRIDLSLISADLPNLPAQSLQAESSPRDAFRLIDQLGSTLRERLEAPPVPSAPAVSRSPAALSAFATGSASLRRGDALAAVTDLEKAVASDPGYSAAWVQLARARESLGRREAALEAARRAVAGLGSSASRSAYEARAVEARLLGHPEKAQEILARLVERFPGDAEAQVELAEAYGEQGSLDRAIAALQTVVRIAPHHPRAWFLLAKYSILAGDLRRAIDDYLVHALVVQNQLGSEEGRADVLNAFGVAYRNLGEMKRAAESFEKAAEIRKRIGEERGYATTLRNLATLDTIRGEHGAAQRRLEEALVILDRLGDGPGKADLYDEFGSLAEERGDYEEALSQYQKALRVRRDLGSDIAFAQSFANVGYACYLLGRYDDAMVYWRQGLDTARKSADPAGVVIATQNLGLLELARGDWDESTKSFLAVLAKSRELGLKESIASALGHLGRLAQYQGRPAAALASYKDALATLRELDDRRGLAEFTLSEAEVLIELGLEKAAGERLQAAAKLLSEEPNREQQAELERLRGEWHLLRGDRGGAREALRRAVAKARESRSIVALLDARLSAAGETLVSGSPRPALAELERLRAEAEALGHARLRLRAAELVARAALAAGHLDRAREAVREGREQAAACGGYGGTYRFHLLQARIFAREGRRSEAAAERNHAIREIAALSRDLNLDQRAGLQRIAEEWSIAEPIKVAKPASRKG